MPDPPGRRPAGEDWATAAADRIVGTIDTVRDKTTNNVQVAARGLVYGLVAAVLGVAALVLLVVLVLRVGYTFVGNIPWVRNRQGRSVWLVDAAVGLFLVLVGLRLQAKGRRTPKR